MTDLRVGFRNNLSVSVPVSGDLTGATATFVAYDSPSQENEVIEGTATIADSTVTAKLSAVDTDIDFAVLYYVVTLVRADGTESDVRTGKLTVGA